MPSVFFWILQNTEQYNTKLHVVGLATFNKQGRAGTNIKHKIQHRFLWDKWEQKLFDKYKLGMGPLNPLDLLDSPVIPIYGPFLGPLRWTVPLTI